MTRSGNTQLSVVCANSTGHRRMRWISLNPQLRACAKVIRDGAKSRFVALFSARITASAKEYEEAVDKFIVGPVDSGSKFHFLWSLGEGEEARGFGKTVLLRHLSRAINKDLGENLLREHDFDEAEARETLVLAAMGTFNKTDVTSLSAVCLEQVRHLAQVYPDTAKSPFEVLREPMLRRLEQDGEILDGQDRAYAEAEAIRHRIRNTDLSLGGKTLGSVDRRLTDLFATGDGSGLSAFLRQADQRIGFELLSTSFIIARAAGIKRLFLFIDEVEAFASADTPKKRRSMEVERFRDIAIGTQPFGEMASYVLTMHPAAARAIDEFWSLARLPKIDHLLRQNQRITVILKPLGRVEEVEKLLVSYLERFRSAKNSSEPLQPFDRAALRVFLEHSGGRPGPILKFAHDLIEEAARHKWARIGEQEARQFMEEEYDMPETPPRARIRRIGAIE
jgi:hypothetical protein